MHLPTPMHRSTAWRRSPPSASWASDGSRATRVGRGRRRSCVRGSGSTMIPGLSTSPGSQAVFQARNASSIAGENWRSSSAPRARPSPCSPDSDPPWATTRSAAALMKAPSRSPRPRPVQPEADAQVDAALAEVAVRDAPQVVVAEQRPQLAQVRGKALRRHDPVLESRPRRGAVREAGRASRAVLADPPQDSLGGRILEQGCVRGAQPGPGGHGQARGMVPELAGRPASGLDQQPGAAGGSRPGSRQPVSSSAVRLSTVKGRSGSRPGTAAAAAMSSAKPRTSRPRSAGGRTRRSVASETTAQVPSLPTSARATSGPRSGRSQSRA